MIVKENFDEIDSFEATYKSFFLKNSNLVIPYINIGISQHELNRSQDIKFLDYCYLAFIDVAYIKINNIIFYENECPKYGCHYFRYLGGINSDTLDETGIEILCKDSFLQTLEHTKVSKEMWIPQKRGRFNLNMNNVAVEEFFNFNYMPQNLKDLVSIEN